MADQPRTAQGAADSGSMVRNRVPSIVNVGDLYHDGTGICYYSTIVRHHPMLRNAPMKTLLSHEMPCSAQQATLESNAG